QPDKTPDKPQKNKPQPQTQPAPVFDSSQLSAEIASLEAQLSKDRQAYAKRPRVSRQNTAATMRDISAWYRDEWRKKVERIGNLNYPDEARRQRIYGSLRMMVIVKSDGTVEELRVLESSGRPVLDEAAMRIVRLSAPFAPFSGELARNYDQVEIIRTWRFERGDTLSSQYQRAGRPTPDSRQVLAAFPRDSNAVACRGFVKLEAAAPNHETSRMKTSTTASLNHHFLIAMDRKSVV